MATKPHGLIAGAATPMPPQREHQDQALVRRVREAGIPESHLASAVNYHRGVADRQPFSRTLVELGLVADQDVARWIAEINGWRYVAPEGLKVRGEAYRALPGAVARSRHAVAIDRRGEVLTVAIADPLAPQFAQVLHAVAERQVEWVISPQADIDACVAEVYATQLEVGGNELERFVEDMLREAAHTRGLSDIHCIPEDRSCEIRWRIDGDLVPWRAIPGDLKAPVAAQLKLSSTRGPDGRVRLAGAAGGLDVANRLDPQDASALRDYGSKRVSLRYSVVPAVNGESIVIRVLDQSAQVGSLESLGMMEDTALRFRAALKCPNGIVLLAGPTGHGKSTTLAAAVPCLDGRNKRVLSIEDPVEYRLRHVTQVSVNPRMTFAAALRAFLRHNPDIILLGEIRDPETAALAVRLSLTGHLILTTVHANTAVQAISRLLDLGVEASLLAATVRLQLSQRLVKRLCPECRRPHRNWAALGGRFGDLLEHGRRSGVLRGEGRAGSVGFEAGGGCAHCQQTGFAGRVGIFELRDLRPAVGALLARPGQPFDAQRAEQIFAECRRAGELAARTLREDGLLKAAQGLTSPEEVLAATLEAGG
jgi:type II secretory ATPase GspE/PulE/Tfp pilus assembly ATPase PilB-like protein